MKTYILIGIAAIVLIVIGVITFELLNKPAATVPDGNVTFPMSSTTNPDGSTASPGTLTVGSQDGQGMVTKDFIHNGTTAQDPQNPGNYYLAGDVGYCTASGTCPTGAASKEYHVVYFAEDKSFIVNLISEPLGQSRLDAEQFLTSTLGLTHPEMCSLNYEVLTTSDVNDTFAGKNLGFSFCTGATKLP